MEESNNCEQAQSPLFEAKALISGTPHQKEFTCSKTLFGRRNHPVTTLFYQK